MTKHYNKTYKPLTLKKGSYGTCHGELKTKRQLEAATLLYWAFLRD